MFTATSFTFFGSLGFFGSGAFDGEAFGMLGPCTQNLRVSTEFALPPRNIVYVLIAYWEKRERGLCTVKDRSLIWSLIE